MQSYNFNPEIMRAYDIRGKYAENLSSQDAYFLGRSIASLISQENLPMTICIGRDGRISSPDLHASLTEGLLHSGAMIIDIGLVATPTLYYSSIIKNTTAGIMITGSHNPGDQNGFKIMYRGASFYGERIQRLSNIAATAQFIDGNGAIEFIDIRHEYVQNLKQNAVKKVGRKLRLAWDSGNGATGELVEMLTQVIDAEHFLTNTKIDGTFPNHHPDPTIPANMKELKNLVLDKHCDMGFAFDGDGDRLGVIDSKGRMVFGDQILLMLAQDLLKRKPGAKVIADVKTSDLILSMVESLGGKPILWKTGHSLIKAKMKEEKALLAGEMSGHLFFGEDYYGFDDALFGACKLINIFSNSDTTIAEAIDNLPKTHSTPELRIEVDESIKFSIIDDLKTILQKQHSVFNDLDGVRVQEDDGWWLARASNTQNSLVIRVEGNSFNSLCALCDKVIGLFNNLGIDATAIKGSINE
jgi:phosphomannomutase